MAENFTTLQCWPGGSTIIYKGDPNGEALRIRSSWGDEATERDATEEEREAIAANVYAVRIREQEVYCLDSCLVDDLMKQGGELPGDLAEEWSYEKVSNMTIDPSEWSVEQCKEWIDDNGGDAPGKLYNPWLMSRDELHDELNEGYDTDDNDERTTQADESDDDLRQRVIDGYDDESIDGIEYWRDAVTDAADDPEIYEWYRVSSWLAERLTSVGECVLDNAYGYWWGRCSTGQDNIMDGVFQKVASASLAAIYAIARK